MRELFRINRIQIQTRGEGRKIQKILDIISGSSLGPLNIQWSAEDEDAGPIGLQ